MAMLSCRNRLLSFFINAGFPMDDNITGAGFRNTGTGYGSPHPTHRNAGNREGFMIEFVCTILFKTIPDG
jgi:hypothetical protein